MRMMPRLPQRTQLTKHRAANANFHVVEIQKANTKLGTKAQQILYKCPSKLAFELATMIKNQNELRILYTAQ